MLTERQKLAKGTPFETWLHLFYGELPGPTVMIVAGIHGKEVGSIRAAQQLVTQLRNQEFTINRGTLIIVPVANQPAFKKRVRGKPDLNRTFPRGQSRKATQVMSRSLFSIMQSYKPAWYLDLHEANGLSSKSKYVLGQTLITNPGNASVPIVRKIIKQMNEIVNRPSHRFHIRLRKLKGSSRTAAAERIHANAVTVETSWSLKMNTRIEYHMQVVQHFIREAGLM
ncbi:succinylglutamate desuccinylase/aspartoacylase family protein [Paenibacillus sp. NPDC057886]|uniref:succinylglutamate desuccinylase/aspartoacylase domain-containing protein n=1 Tax=Paenibacillus sp. NPDC057886 TaxID=3346270 RepID=UPI0036C9E104